MVEIAVEAVAFDECSVGFLELVAVQLDEDGADVVDELIDPGQVEEGSVDDLSRY